MRAGGAETPGLRLVAAACALPAPAFAIFDDDMRAREDRQELRTSSARGDGQAGRRAASAVERPARAARPRLADRGAARRDRAHARPARGAAEPGRRTPTSAEGPVRGHRHAPAQAGADEGAGGAAGAADKPARRGGARGRGEGLRGGAQPVQARQLCAGDRRRSRGCSSPIRRASSRPRRSTGSACALLRRSATTGRRSPRSRR